MDKYYILTVDAGTSGVKCSIVDLKGEIILIVKSPWEYFTPEGLERIGKEFEAEKFWKIITESIKKCIKSVEISPEQIIGITSTGQRQGCVFLDKNGKELYAGPNFDVRGLFYGADIESILGEELIYKTTGHLPAWLFLPARLFWFKENKPDVYERINKILMISDWINFKLTGNYWSDPTNASETLVFDINKREWSEEIISKLNLSKDLFPQIKLPSEKIGEIDKLSSSLTGLKKGTPVFISGADTQCAVLGAGCLKEGDCAGILGSTGVLQMVSSSPIFDKEKCMWTSCHILKGKWVVEGNAGFSGELYRWFKESFWKDVDYQKIDEFIENTKPDYRNPFTFLGPAKFNLRNINPNRYGVFFLPIPVSEERSNLVSLNRAIFENIAYGLKDNLKALEKITGKNVECLIICGGLSKSRSFVKILADVLGIILKPVKYFEATSIGCAISVAVGIGVYKDFETAVKSMVKYADMIEPEKENDIM